MAMMLHKFRYQFLDERPLPLGCIRSADRCEMLNLREGIEHIGSERNHANDHSNSDNPFPSILRENESTYAR